MKKSLAILIACKISIMFGMAQPSFTVSEREGAAKVTTNVLAVVLAEVEDRTIKKLSKKPEAVSAYKTSVEEFNGFLKKAVESEWNISKAVQFISAAEANKLKEGKASGYSLLELTEVKNYKMGDFYSPNPNSGFNSARDRAYHMSASGESRALTIVNASAPNKEIVTSYLPSAGVSQGVVTFMVMHLRNQITDCLDKGITNLSGLKKDIEKRQSLLKTKTLLIFNPLISNGLQKTIDKKEIEKFYNYKYEVVPFEKVDELITAKNPDYAYIWAVPAGAVSGSRVLFNYFVIDAEDARPLYLTGKAVLGANGDFHQAHLMMIDKEIR